jgi:HAE1 family hydrophobic/amphiphilic exporter-1
MAIVILGYISYKKLGIELFPDLNNPRLFSFRTAAAF